MFSIYFIYIKVLMYLLKTTGHSVDFGGTIVSTVVTRAEPHNKVIILSCAHYISKLMPLMLSSHCKTSLKQCCIWEMDLLCKWQYFCVCFLFQAWLFIFSILSYSITRLFSDDNKIEFLAFQEKARLHGFPDYMHFKTM
jgi:hypothetical protein